MKWQEYQEAVAKLYDQMGGLGIVRRNVFLPDRHTGTKRQIDVLLEIEARGHSLRILIDAKFKKDVLDVKDIEEVASLANAIQASKAVIVTANGWNESASTKAAAKDLDLRILSMENALELIVKDKWQMCEFCAEDCIVMDQNGVIENHGLLLWWLSGQCRHCLTALVWCQDCGKYVYIEVGKVVHCDCGHTWSTNANGIALRLAYV